MAEQKTKPEPCGVCGEATWSLTGLCNTCEDLDRSARWLIQHHPAKAVETFRAFMCMAQASID